MDGAKVKAQIINAGERNHKEARREHRSDRRIQGVMTEFEKLKY